MGEWTTVDLRKMAGALPFADMDRGIPETSNALRWAAERIEYLEKFIETTEQEAVAQLPACDTVSLLQNLGALIADATNEGDYDPENDLVRDPFCRRVIDGLNAAIIEIERLSAMVYETGPGEFSPDGWTWKQAFQAEKKRREEAEAAIETLHEKYAQERMSRKRESLSDNTKMENQ